MIKYFISCLLIFMHGFSVYANSHHPQEFLQSVHGTKNEGKQIYNHYCANCHNQKPLIPLGAPRIGEKDDWKLRLKRGFSLLFKNTNEGFNAMPARGGCFECTDEQLILAILAMVPEEAKKDLLNALRDHKKNNE